MYFLFYIFFGNPLALQVRLMACRQTSVAREED
jgi:hypothetical protein